MNLYLRGIPDSLWTLFGTGYLGYTMPRGPITAGERRRSDV